MAVSAVGVWLSHQRSAARVVWLRRCRDCLISQGSATAPPPGPGTSVSAVASFHLPFSGACFLRTVCRCLVLPWRCSSHWNCNNVAAMSALGPISRLSDHPLTHPSSRATSGGDEMTEPFPFDTPFFHPFRSESFAWIMGYDVSIRSSKLCESSTHAPRNSNETNHDVGYSIRTSALRLTTHVR